MKRLAAKTCGTVIGSAAIGWSVLGAPPPASGPGNAPLQVNPGQTQPVVSPGRAPAVVNPGQADVGRSVSPAQTGGVNPGQAGSRLNNPGRLDLEAQRGLPGQLNVGQTSTVVVVPGQNDGGMLSPGQLDPRMVNPGQSTGMMISPGRVGNEIVNLGRGDPATTVDPGQEGGTGVTRPQPTIFVVGTPAGTTEGKVRIANTRKRLELANPAIAQRLADVQQMPIEQQNEALYAMIDEMVRAQQSTQAQAAGTSQRTRQPAATPAAEPRKIWVTGTPIRNTASGTSTKR